MKVSQITLDDTSKVYINKEFKNRLEEVALCELCSDKDSCGIRTDLLEIQNRWMIKAPVLQCINYVEAGSAKAEKPVTKKESGLSGFSIGGVIGFDKKGDND